MTGSMLCSQYLCMKNELSMEDLLNKSMYWTKKNERARFDDDQI